ncbi:MAG: hypothetical protein KDK25_09475 [Leptospiraceae bacterium]|nr:hypothetical protein [Leptospiraceae bacterium]
MKSLSLIFSRASLMRLADHRPPVFTSLALLGLALLPPSLMARSPADFAKGIVESPSGDAADIAYLGVDGAGQAIYATVSYSEGNLGFYSISGDGIQGNGFAIDYFQGKNLAKKIKSETRNKLFMPMGNGSPADGVPRDDFSLRATAILKVDRPGNYTFITRSDDGVRLYLDGKRIIDQWKPMGTTEYRSTVYLQAGRSHRIQLEYFEQGGAGHLELLWQRPGADMPAHLTTAGVLSPVSLLVPETLGLHAPWAAEYFKGRDLKQSLLKRSESRIEHDFNKSGPAPGLPRTDFSARWTGRLKIPKPGAYTFYTTSDDGVRLYIDGKAIIDEWRGMAPTEHSARVELNGDADIVLEYFQGGGGASVQLEWEGPDSARRILSPAGGFRALQPELQKRFVRRILTPPPDQTGNLQKREPLRFALISGGIESELSLFSVQPDGSLERSGSYNGSSSLQAIFHADSMILADAAGLLRLRLAAMSEEPEVLLRESGEIKALCLNGSNVLALFAGELYSNSQNVALMGILKDGEEIQTAACLNSDVLALTDLRMLLLRPGAGSEIQVASEASLPEPLLRSAQSGSRLQVLDAKSRIFVLGKFIYAYQGKEMEQLFTGSGPLRCAMGPVPVCLDSGSSRLLQFPK